MFRVLGVQSIERRTERQERKHPLVPHSSPTLDFPLLSGKRVYLDFSGGQLSSDGGLVLLAQLDRQLGLTKRVAACIRDERLASRVQHSLLDLIRQRVYQIAAGYEDCNDADHLRGDPALKVALGRSPTGISRIVG